MLNGKLARRLTGTEASFAAGVSALLPENGRVECRSPEGKMAGSLFFREVTLEEP
jgi:hypothetical protein